MRKSLTASHQPSVFSHRLSKLRALHSGRRGVALVLTLGILALVTLLVVAFVTSMRVESMASKNYNDILRARELARGAVDQAVALIRSCTPALSTPNSAYITAPGVIYTWNGAIWTTTPLFTADPTAVLNFDLNANSVITGSGFVYQANSAQSKLMVGWSNIFNTVNGQLAGRVAFWVDDESTKVNLNSAWGRVHDLEGTNTDAIDLGFFENFVMPTDPDNIHNFVTGYFPLDSIESVMLAPPFPAGPNISSDKFTRNKFYMTVNSISPDVTPWGTKRLNLSNLVANATTLTLKQAAVGIIASNLSDTVNLGPMFGNKTFANKYNVYQIAANIVDYIDTDLQPTDDSGNDPPNYLGLEETPYLNELVISNTVTITPQVLGKPVVTISNTVIAELWYMYTNTAGWALSAGSQVNIQAFATTPTITFVNCLGPASLSLVTPITIQVTSSMASNSFLCVTSVPAAFSPPFTITINNTNLDTTITLSKGTIKAIFRNSVGRIDYALIPVSAQTLTIFHPYSLSTFNVNWVSACNDPRVKPVSNNWTPLPSTQATLGLPNTLNNVLNLQVITPTTNSPFVNIQGDGDSSCHVISGSRDRGTMNPSELGFIHTGYPWRTFWLQPEPAAEMQLGRVQIPDWAALDLFSATDTTNVPGRMNINMVIANASPLTFAPRAIPAASLLTNHLTSSTPPWSIYNFTKVTNALCSPLASSPLQATLLSVNSRFNTFPTTAFRTIGEICEVPCLATNDLEAGSIYTNKFIAETPVRGIANLITTRSSTFTVWATGQALNGLGRVTAEAKVQAVVERDEDDTVTPPAIRFRIKYYRYIHQ